MDIKRNIKKGNQMSGAPRQGDVIDLRTLEKVKAVSAPTPVEKDPVAKAKVKKSLPRRAESHSVGSKPAGEADTPRSAAREQQGKHEEETFFNLSPTNTLRDRIKKMGVTVQKRPGTLFALQRKPIEKLTSIRSTVGIIFMLMFVPALFIFTELTTVDIFFWVFFLSMLIWRIDSRVAIFFALVSLILIPVFLVAARAGFAPGESWADTVAVWAYLFLVIGVVTQIFEYIMQSRNGERVKSKKFKVKS